MKKFRKRGNKEGALTAFYQLEEDGLGKLLELQGSKGTSTVSYGLCNVYTAYRYKNIRNYFKWMAPRLIPSQICRKRSFTFISVSFHLSSSRMFLYGMQDFLIKTSFWPDKILYWWPCFAYLETCMSASVGGQNLESWNISRVKAI